MGMAPYGTPRYVDKVWQVVHQSSDGSFELDLDYFSFHHSTTRSYSDRIVGLFGPPRSPDTPPENQHYADVAASIQQVTEELVLGLVRAVHARTGSTALCMAGGVALNSVANGRILRETPIRQL